MTEKEYALSDLATGRTEAIDAERIASEQIAELEAQANRDRAKIAILTAQNEHKDSRAAELAQTIERDRAAQIRNTAELNAALAAERTKAANIERVFAPRPNATIKSRGILCAPTRLTRSIG